MKTDKDSIINLAIVTTIIVTVFTLVYLMFEFNRYINWKLSYEESTIEIVKSMVRPEALRKE